MHSVERDELKRFIAPYLTLEHDAEEWRGGYFKVKEGPTLRDSKDRVASIRWEKKGGHGPREVRDVLVDLESAIDLITMEAHDRVWIVAFHKGENNPTAWLPIALADGMGQGHHNGEMEAALTQRMAKAGAHGDILAISLARIGMAAQAQSDTIMDKYVQAIEQLAVVTAENRNLQMLLEGAMSINGGQNTERMADLFKEAMPHIGPVLAQAAVSLLPGDIPKEPGPRADYHLRAIKANMLALVALAQAHPAVLTPERQAAIAELVAEVLRWQQAPA